MYLPTFLYIGYNNLRVTHVHKKYEIQISYDIVTDENLSFMALRAVMKII